MGGAAFSVPMILAQIFPFVALKIYDDDDDDDEQIENVRMFLIGSAILWLVLNAVFFNTINLNCINSFFSRRTAPQYTAELYQTAGDEDYLKFDAAFTNRIDYAKNIHADVKEWVRENLELWKAEKPLWFNLEKIPEEFLPAGTMIPADEMVARKRRRSSSVRMKEAIGLDDGKKYRVHPAE